MKTKQLSLIQQSHKYALSHGGILRRSQNGRMTRPLSTKQPLHLVLKINKSKVCRSLRLPRNHQTVMRLFKKYAAHFIIRIDQISIQNDLIHCLIRAPKRSAYIGFFKVIAGQIAQNFLYNYFHSISAVTDTRNVPKLWKFRPFTRVIRGFKAYTIVRNYIQLNEKEALQIIPYRKSRLPGLSSADWKLLWS